MPKQKILIVDDAQDNVEILEELLGDDYLLAHSSSGTECLAKATEFRPDIVLLDVMMPGIDGYETCRRLRSDNSLLNMRIIFISAKAQTQEKLAGYEAGADDYIVKPFNKDCVKKKVLFYAHMASIETSGLRHTLQLNHLAGAMPDHLHTIKKHCQAWKDSCILNEQQKQYLNTSITNVDQMLETLKTHTCQPLTHGKTSE